MNEYAITFYCEGPWTICKTVYAPHSFQAMEIANVKFAQMFNEKIIQRVVCVEQEKERTK